MNTISDELIYHVHILHSALNKAQKNIVSLEQENNCLKEKIFALSGYNNSCNKSLDDNNE